MVVPLVPPSLLAEEGNVSTVDQGSQDILQDGRTDEVLSDEDENNNQVKKNTILQLVRNPTIFLPSNIPYKDVVVIGNGPSGIMLSYLLAGNWPYYNGMGEAVNDMLHYRLLAASKKAKTAGPVSIVEQDLGFLSQGLEGRSSNPIALLFDTLNHPQADLGLELPSLLNWEYVGDKAEIDHVVIGRGPPGGAWQSMDGNVLTISLGCWMELPGMNFRDWEAKRRNAQEEEEEGDGRASVASVAQYYCDYVRRNGLRKYFVSDSVVTEVVKIPATSVAGQQYLAAIKEEGQDCLGEKRGPAPLLARDSRRHTISEIPYSGRRRKVLRKRGQPLWRVTGYTRTEDENNVTHLPFSYVTSNVVLATGASDRANRLNVPGEETLPFVFHDLNRLEQLIRTRYLNPTSDPVLVVGAGLSAADAIIACLLHSIPVKHVFRRSTTDPEMIFRQLPANMYPEYHKVYQMMQNPELGGGLYKPYEMCTVNKIRADRRVNISGPECCGIVKVSAVAVCVGYRPDLSFLNGLDTNLGVFTHTPVDCKSNPVAINYTTHESTREPGLFALGPIVGENFVRFLQGGALAITGHLVQMQKSHQKEQHSEEQSRKGLINDLVAEQC